MAGTNIVHYRLFWFSTTTCGLRWTKSSNDAHEVTCKRCVRGAHLDPKHTDIEPDPKRYKRADAKAARFKAKPQTEWSTLEQR